MKLKFWMVAFACTIAAMGCVHRDARAQVPAVNDNARLTEYMKSPAVLRQLVSHALEKDKKFDLQKDCEDISIGKMMVLLLTPLDYPETSDSPVKGRWHVIYIITKCGVSRTHNVIFQANAEGAPRSGYLYTGLSLASERLMRDAMPSATLAALLKKPRSIVCDDIDLYQIKVTVPPKLSALETSEWKENWTFWMCGTLYDINIRFVPKADGKGVNFHTEPVEPQFHR